MTDRIVFIQPCCIGDVILATPALAALRKLYPEAHITWAIGTWSRSAIENHHLIDELLDTGNAALPVYSPGDFWRFVRQLRRGKYDLAVSLVRSPLMSLAVLLSGIPHRAGLDSAGRGFGYNLRAPINPREIRHEAEIYLDVIRVLGGETDNCYVNVPVENHASMRTLLQNRGVRERFMVINPAGGSNPGMVMDTKRYPPAKLADLANRVSKDLDLDIVMIAGPKDQAIVDEVCHLLPVFPATFVGTLKFTEIAALDSLAQVYIGNDTGLTHLAAATGAKTAMIMGPSDPRRYAPFAPNAIALWKPTSLNGAGVAGGTPDNWDWSLDGISVDDAYTQIIAFLTS